MKTSLAPGSKVVTDYLAKAGLTPYLDALGFNLVGYGCTTCIGNSGPLPDDVARKSERRTVDRGRGALGQSQLRRPHSSASAGELHIASPPLVVAYAIAGKMDFDITTESLGKDKSGNDVFLKDIWPTDAEIEDVITANVSGALFRERYSDVFAGDARWQATPAPAASDSRGIRRASTSRSRRILTACPKSRKR